MRSSSTLRSVICTRALGRYLDVREPESLARAIDDVLAKAVFERRVFFVRNLGFVRPTAARRISFEESLRFERMQEEVYRESGFALESVEAAGVEERAAAIVRSVGR